jgi:hypothetical protein
MDVLSIEEAEAVIFGDGDSGEGGNRLQDIITDISTRFALYTGRIDWGPDSSRTEYLNGGNNWLSPLYRPISSITSIHQDPAHEWPASTLLDPDDYYIDTDDTGLIWLESGCFVNGPKTVQLIYTAGYSSTSAVPSQVKAMAKIQTLHEWNKTERAGRRNTEEGTNIGELLPEVRIGLRSYMLSLPFV